MCLLPSFSKNVTINANQNHSEAPPHPLGWLELKIRTITRADEDMEKLEPSCVAVGATAEGWWYRRQSAMSGHLTQQLHA